MIAIAAAVIKHEFFPPSPAATADRKLSSIQWHAAVSRGHWLGSPGAAVVLVEFGDFQCPACGRFANGPLRAAQSKYGANLAVLFRHWPLPYHPWAYAAAKASECAGAQGRFADFYRVVYRQQDSLGLKPMQRFATEAGVNDTAAFDECAARHGSFSSIDVDAREAIELGGTGTPTLLINHVRLGVVPDTAALFRAIDRALANPTER